MSSAIHDGADPGSPADPSWTWGPARSRRFEAAAATLILSPLALGVAGLLADLVVEGQGLCGLAGATLGALLGIAAMPAAYGARAWIRFRQVLGIAGVASCAAIGTACSPLAASTGLASPAAFVATAALMSLASLWTNRAWAPALADDA